MTALVPALVGVLVLIALVVLWRDTPDQAGRSDEERTSKAERRVWLSDSLATKGGLRPAGKASWEGLDQAARRRVDRAVVHGKRLDSPAEASAALELARRRQPLLGGRQNSRGLFLGAFLLVGSLVRLASGTVDYLAIEGVVGGALFILLNLYTRRLARNAERATELNRRLPDQNSEI